MEQQYTGIISQTIWLRMAIKLHPGCDSLPTVHSRHHQPIKVSIHLLCAHMWPQISSQHSATVNIN